MLILGIVLFALGLLLSIAWHELGHYTAARRFGIRVPQFMVGFGPTVWSRQRGETEWGIKAVPLGGYIRMIGMIPPAPGQKVGRSRRSGPFQGMIDDIRQENNADFRPGDEDRQFWTRKPWQRIVVMFAGPFQNLILAAAIFLFVLVVLGIKTPTTTVDTVSRCLVPVTQAQAVDDCPRGAPQAPAYAAGLRPEDKIVSFAGRTGLSWDELTDAIRASNGPTPMVVERGGQQVPLTVDIVTNAVQMTNGQFAQVGYLGIGPVQVRESASPGEIVAVLGSLIGRTVQSIVTLPARVDDLVGAVFFGQERGVDTPVSVVGASVIGGKYLERNDPIIDEASNMLTLLAGVNLSLFVLNLLPILPLDGGHMLPALWEAGKKRIARWRGRPDPGPVDLAKLMPLAYAFALVIMSYGALVIVADIVNPIKVPGL